jgi:hypothetical protein
LTVSYNGLPITNDVSGVQVAFWNAGRRSIKGRDIYQGGDISVPITLSISNVQILDARFRRPVPEGALEIDPILKMVRLSWRVLEESEGFSVEIIYAGNPAAPIEIHGKVVEQRKLEAWRFPKERSLWEKALVVLVCLLGFFLAGYLTTIIEKWRGTEFKVSSLAYILCGALLILYLVIHFFGASGQPPFAF